VTAEQQRIQAEYAAALDAGKGTIDIGRTIICDRCDTDMTDDPRSGGFMFGSYAYGPCCVAEALASIRRYREEDHIGERCPEGVPFADWVRSLRGDHNQITVRSSGRPR
jgi:hypothetical protein